MQRIKFILCGLIILVAVIYLIASSTQASVEYFMTVDELKARATNLSGKNLRVSGAVIGDTIQYDPQTLSLSFDIAHVSGNNKEIEDQGGLAEVLHQAVSDKSRARIKVIYVGPKPDLLGDEAQAVMTGHLGDDGIFYADELFLKCPTRYEEAIPEQATN